MRRRLLVMMMLATTATAYGQSDTGRHRPAPAPVLPDTTGTEAGSAWQICLNLGLASAGDLFRATAGGSVPWNPEGGAPFGSQEFVVTLDEGFAFGVSIVRDLGPWLCARADAAFTRLPMTAEARVGETVRLYEYDELSIATFSIALEGRLTQTPSHPYLMAGAGATIADGNGTDDYDQTVLAGRFGAGYHQVVTPSLALRLEICNTLQTLDFEDYQPPVDLPLYPDVKVENRGPQHILEITAGLAVGF